MARPKDALEVKEQVDNTHLLHDLEIHIKIGKNQRQSFLEKLVACIVCFLKARLVHAQKVSHQIAVKPLGVRMAERDM